jgi:serine/threonine-protein kinase
VSAEPDHPPVERIGDYQLISRVARGGMAEVWTARRIGRPVHEPLLCIKRLDPSLKNDIDFVEMFRDEASLVLDFDHDNIVKVFELIDDGEELAMVMELVDGPSLSKARTALEMQVGPGAEAFGVDEALQIAIYLCRALHHAHTRTRHGEPLRIVHRDVSPQNVLLTTDGRLKLVDFGIAKATQRLTRTHAGELKGKCSYMAPEQVRGEPLDHRADQFAAGILLWEMLTGRRLFSGRNEVLILEQVARSDAVPPSSVKRGIPKSVDRAVLRALGWHADERFADMAAFEAALQRCLDEWVGQDLPSGIAPGSTVDLSILVGRAARAPVQSESGAMRTRIIANATTVEADDRSNDDPSEPSLAERLESLVTDPFAQPEHTGQFFERRRRRLTRTGLVAGAFGLGLAGLVVAAAVWWAERSPAPTPTPPPPAAPLITTLDDATTQLRALATLATTCSAPCLVPLRERTAKGPTVTVSTHVDAVALDQCLLQCRVAGAGRYQLPPTDVLEERLRVARGHPCRTELLEDLIDAAKLTLIARAALADAVNQCSEDAATAEKLRADSKKPLSDRLADPAWPKKKKGSPAVIHTRTAELVRRGRLAATAGEAERAKGLLVEALTYEPQRIELHERVGNAFRALGDPVGAAHHYRLYFHAFPDDPDRQRAELYAARYRQSLALEPSHHPSSDERAVRTHFLVRSAQHKPASEALSLLQQAEALSPEDVLVLERLAATYVVLDQPEAARGALERAVKLKPSKRLRDQLKAIGS